MRSRANTATPRPPLPTLRSCLERQPGILLRQRRLSVFGSAQIIELAQAHLFLEWRLVRRAVQEHRQPPRHAHGAPDATQRHVGVAIEIMVTAGATGDRKST